MRELPQLYELVTQDGVSLSPFVWRTKLALAHKCVDYVSCPVGFLGIPRIGNGDFTTVPVLHDGENWVADSWNIADFLESNYPERPDIFPSAAARSFAEFFDRWIGSAIFPLIFRLCVFDIFNRLAPADGEYFRTSREKRLGKTLEQAHAERGGLTAQLGANLAPLRSLLKTREHLAGEAPGYVDFIAIGTFIWGGTVATTELLDPADPVAAWVDRALARHGIDRSQMQAIPVPA